MKVLFLFPFYASLALCRVCGVVLVKLMLAMPAIVCIAFIIIFAQCRAYRAGIAERLSVFCFLFHNFPLYLLIIVIAAMIALAIIKKPPASIAGLESFPISKNTAPSVKKAAAVNMIVFFIFLPFIIVVFNCYLSPSKKSRITKTYCGKSPRPSI